MLNAIRAWNRWNECNGEIASYVKGSDFLIDENCFDKVIPNSHTTHTHTHTHNKSSKIFFSQFGSHLIWLYKIRTLTFSSRRILDTRIECTNNGFLLQTKQTNFVESFTLLMSNFIRKWKRRRSANRHLNRSSYTFENAIQRWRRE